MIHYQLRCGDDHAFDGWFRDSATFDAQARDGLVACPSCGDVKVRRALMAPAVPRKGRRAPAQVAQAEAPAATTIDAPTTDVAAAPSPPASPASLAASRLPDELRSALQRMRAEVEQRCEYVGDKFSEEARRIHDGDATVRPIYGETTLEQAEALADDGIEVARIPWIPRADG